MAEFDLKKIIEWLSHLLRCPVCNYRYNLENTRVIDSKEDKQAGANLLVHTDCENCKSSVMFNITVEGPEVFSVGMVTDLTSKDSSKFKNAKPISSDEILATHKFLQEFNGDFRSALK